MDLVFYIPHYRSDDESVTLLNHCMRSISLFYPDSEIIVCESPSTFTSSIEYCKPANVTWIPNPIPNSITIGCFKDYLERCSQDKRKGIFMNDTIIFKDRILPERLARSFGFLWHCALALSPIDIEHPQMRVEFTQMLEESRFSKSDYKLALCNTCFGTYESMQWLWNSIPFERYMTLEPRNLVLMDLERVIGFTAFRIGLVSVYDTYSLFGEILEFPDRFNTWYTGQSFEELMRYPYKEAAIKIWKMRTLSGNC